MLALLRPRFWPGHLAMLACVAIAGGLGLWQLDAWSQHRAHAERDLEHKPAVPLHRLMTGDSPFPGDASGRPVSFTGSWLGQDTVYVADRELHGHTGYWVVTPVVVDGSSSAMPVVRGWAARPESTTPTGAVAVTGWLQASEGDDTIDDDPTDDVIPSMRVGSLVERVDTDLYSGYVVARDVAARSGGSTGSTSLSKVTPDFPKVSWTTGVRNLFYALEWWVFGGFAVFIWGRWCADELHPPDPEDQPDPDDAHAEVSGA